MTDIVEEGALTADEILTFGPVVEAAVWGVSWLQEARAPIAVAAGRAKLGKVFDEQGKGKAVLIRPCMSRGRRVRGLSPVYTPTMLEANASVWTGWPMYLDHVPAELAEAMAKRGRSVKELGGQVLTPMWDRDFTQEDDAAYGYQKGGVLAEIWATPFLRSIVGENPNVLHTSISAWPTAGKPGKVPWKPAQKGMIIEGIRKQPQGSVDFVPRGGAGGRVLLAEGADPDTSAWPEATWSPEDVQLVVSLAESFYASADMSGSTTQGGSGSATAPDLRNMQPHELRAWMQESAPHLLPALAESVQPTTPAPAAAPAPAGASLTEADVQRMLSEHAAAAEKPEVIEARLTEMFEAKLEEREEQRSLAGVAAEMIRVAEGIPASWKADLTTRYAMTPAGPSPALLVEAEDDDDRSPVDILKEAVTADLEHARDLIAEAQGKPRVTGEGGGSRTAAGDERTSRESGGKLKEGKVPYWRQSFADMGVVESVDKALTIHGVDKVEG